MEFKKDNRALVFKRAGETVRIEPWGADSLRIRATMLREFTGNDWALSQAPGKAEGTVELYEKEHITGEGTVVRKPYASVTNGRIRAEVNFAGVITVYDGDRVLLCEYYRLYDGTVSQGSRCLKIPAREWKGIIGGTGFALKMKFEANKGEKIYGMGQYQQSCMDMKGCVLELAQRNSQASVPFYISSMGYGMLWNNPAVGRVTFGNNYTEWVAESTRQMDYWITVADTPKEILSSYTSVTGRAPAFPEDLMGLWQCKLRYRTQDEVLDVARKYISEGIKPDMMVVDFFHWTVQGDWKFDKTYWPDPKAMTDELHSMGIKAIVSVWPSVDRRSENFYPMTEKGLLIRTERGAAQTYDYQGDCVSIDPFNPETAEYVWQVCKKNYYDLGFDGFWLDNSEPDFGVYDYENYRYCAGPALECSNIYPQMYSRIFDDPMKKVSKECFANLMRCAWAGSQKYSNVIWSGDIPSTFYSFREQVMAGLSIGVAGIPWWTTDIGGFMTDDVKDPVFRQLLIRWFQFAVYSPVLRMHGDRGPYDIESLDDRERGGGYMHTGQPNELWSYGEDNYRIMRDYLNIRLEMKDYIRGLFEEASATGAPLIRTMFFEFPQDGICWELSDQYMFGSKYLVAPVFEYDSFERSVYLPKGSWRLTSTGEIYEGEQYVTVAAPVEYMPVFEKLG